MKKTILFGKFTLPLAALCVMLTFSLCNDETNPPPPLPPPTPTITLVEEPGRPNLDTFQFNTNIEFHEASWQYFKWLTSESQGDSGKLVFETLYNAEKIGPDMKRANGLTLVQSAKSDKGDLIGGVHQAGSDGILIDQNQRAVYTSIHIDQKYHDFIQKNKLYNANALQAFPDTTNFPDYAFSLKVAWKVVEDGDTSVDDYYQTTADLVTLKEVNGKIIETDSSENATVAMAGFHIALKVPGHGEMIWATFEHDRNAPDFPANSKSGTIVSNDNYVFYAAGTTVNNVNLIGPQEMTGEDQKFTSASVTQVARRYPFGSPANPTNGQFNDKSNVDNIIQLNNAYAPARTGVWQNYRELGAIWFNSPNLLKPNMSVASNSDFVTGSRFLSNSVIETFTQKTGSENQCFSCHDSQGIGMTNPEFSVAGKNILTSHILVKNYIKKRFAEK